MRNLHNIEKSAFHRGKYVGWDKEGNRYAIYRYLDGWRASQATGVENNYLGIPASVYCKRLCDISAELETMG